jgi:two-component system, cell cycle sensor histidine kinase and response regulator CckA
MTDLSPLTAAHPAQTEPAHWQGDPRSSGCVLVVEDNAAIRLLVAQFLPMFGFSAKEAANGREALALMRADPHHYVLILLDLRLPGMDSPELLSEVHLIRPDLPVVIMTGYLRDKACEKMAGHKIAGYIHKPFTPAGLAREIRNALNS